MKLELPFAIFLLAAGCLLWLGGGSFYRNTQNSASETQKTVVPSKTTTISEPIKYPIQLVAKQEPAVSDKSENASTFGSLKGAKLLEQVAANIVSSPPIESSVLLTVDLFNQHLVTQGKYIQLGQGSRKSRLDFQYDLEEGEGTGKLTQICDGRFFYSIQETGEEKNLRFVDLYQLATADQQGLLAQPTAWMATGGLSSLMQHLAQAFDFAPITKGTISGVPTLVLRGTWKLEYLKRLTDKQLDPQWLNQPVRWDKLPPQLPHVVELHLGADQFLPLFPYRIVFSRYDDGNEQKPPTPIVRFEMNEVSKLKSVDQEWFVVQSGATNQIDLTEELASRVRFISKSIRTAKQNSNKLLKK
ncbi:MAG: hypothetical protein MK106_03675 [Mariniblastus sp.]|nr:hypothetical protein [Mariniblastus sp.]